MLYEPLKHELSPAVAHISGSCLSVLVKKRVCQIRLVAFFTYLLDNAAADDKNKFDACCRILACFTQFDKLMNARLLLFFLGKCRESPRTKQEYNKVIVRYLAVYSSIQEAESRKQASVKAGA